MSLLKSGPTEGRKRRDPWWGFLRRATGKPLGKTPNLSEQLGRCISRCTTLTMTTRGPMMSPTPSRRWPPPLASWALISLRSRRNGLAKMTSRSLTHMAESSPKDIHFFWVVPHTKLPKIMGLRRIHSPKVLRWWGGLSFCLWCGERGTEWRHSDKLPVNEPFPPGPHLWLMPRVHHNQHWCYAPSLTAV